MTDEDQILSEDTMSPTAWVEARAAADRRRIEQARRMQEDHRLDPLRTLTARRALVVTAGALVALCVGLIWSDAGWPLGTMGYVAFLAGFGIHVLLQRVLRHAEDAPDEARDEGQDAAWQAATRVAYQILGVTTVAALLTTMLVVGDDAGQRHLEALFLGFALLAFLLPSAIRAWTEDEV